MNYRTLILTAFMVIGCMSNATENRPQSTSGQSCLNASIWGLGGLTAFLGIKTGYHFVQACRYNKQYPQLPYAKTAHNKAVMDAGRSKFEKISQSLSSSGLLIPDIENIIINKYSSMSGFEYFNENKDLFFRDAFGMYLSKLNTAGAFASLSDDEKDQLRTRKHQIQEHFLKHQTQEDAMRKLNERRFKQHSEQQWVTGTLFFVSGSALMGSYLFKKSL